LFKTLFVGVIYKRFNNTINLVKRYFTRNTTAEIVAIVKFVVILSGAQFQLETNAAKVGSIFATTLLKHL